MVFIHLFVDASPPFGFRLGEKHADGCLVADGSAGRVRRGSSKVVPPRRRRRWSERAFRRSAARTQSSWPRLRRVEGDGDEMGELGGPEKNVALI